MSEMMDYEYEYIYDNDNEEQDTEVDVIKPILDRLENLVQRLNAYNINQVPNYTVVVQYLQTNNYGRSMDEVIDYTRQRQWFEGNTNYSTTRGRNWKTFGYTSSKPYFGLNARQAFAIKEWLLENQEKGLNINDFRLFKNSPPPSLHESVEKIIIDLSKPTNQHQVDYYSKLYLQWQTKRDNMLIQRQRQPRVLEKLDNLQHQQKMNIEQHNQWLRRIQLLLRKRQLQRDADEAIDNTHRYQIEQHIARVDYYLGNRMVLRKGN
ncbi:hypothetical protein BJ944DRAFT_232392 [Cunninghamella echinulata]|nr:hypothetical protein BJ944DRAFT_232392 [Cunninghamella echinulata]